jgi:hypothetical protein
MGRRAIRRATPTLVVAAVVLALGTTSGAVAGSLVTSREIADNTIRSVDVRNDTLRTGDVRDGTLHSVVVRDGTLETEDLSASTLSFLRANGALGVWVMHGTRTPMVIEPGQESTVYAKQCQSFAVPIFGGYEVLDTDSKFTVIATGIDEDQRLYWTTLINNGAESIRVHVWAACAEGHFFDEH